MSAALPAKRTDMALTVIVGNADDTGEVTLQWLQPEVDTPIRATLTDPDGGITRTSGVDVVHIQGCRYPRSATDFHWNEVTGEGLVTTVRNTHRCRRKHRVVLYPAGGHRGLTTDAAVDEGKTPAGQGCI